MRLFALLAFPLFALNGVGLRGEVPPQVLRAFGACYFLLFLFSATEVCMRLFGPPGVQWEGKTHLVAFGLADAERQRRDAARTVPLLSEADAAGRMGGRSASNPRQLRRAPTSVPTTAATGDAFAQRHA